MSILKLFVDTFVSFLKREVIIISLWIENIVVLDLEVIIQKGKNGENWICESSTIVLIFNYS